MLNKRIILSGLSIMASLAIMGGATFAFFSDQASSTGNTFGAGSLDLQIDDSNEPTPVDNVTATFNMPSIAPGDKSSQEISFHNNGTVSIAEIAMGLTSTNTDPDADASDIRNVLNLQVVAGGTASEGDCTGGTDVTSAIDTAVGNGTGPLTMAELNGDTYDSLPIPLAASANGKVCIQVALDDDAGDVYQGDSASASFVFDAHQDISQ